MGVARVHYKPGADIPAKASVDVVGGTFVKVAAGFDGRNPVVAPAGAGDVVLGVVAHDQKAGEVVTVYRDSVVEVAADAGVKAGNAVAAGANGKAVKVSEGVAAVGLAVSDAADGTVAVALN